MTARERLKFIAKLMFNEAEDMQRVGRVHGAALFMECEADLRALADRFDAEEAAASIENPIKHPQQTLLRAEARAILARLDADLTSTPGKQG